MIVSQTYPDRALAFRLAGAASCDWRTAERFLRGETIRGLAATRLTLAAAQLGLSGTSATGSALDVASGALAISSANESR